MNQTQVPPFPSPNWDLPTNGAAFPYPIGTPTAPGFGWSKGFVYSNTGTITVSRST